MRRAQRPLGDDPLRLLEQPLVVRGDPHVATRCRTAPRACHEARSHGMEIAVLDVRRLDVDPLAHAHVRPEVGELIDVGERPLQRRLQHDADVVESGVAQIAVDRERRVRRRRVLHVDADEVVRARARRWTSCLEVRSAQRGVELEPERSRLDADVRVEVAAVDLGEHLLVGVRDHVRLRLVRDLLAQHVDRRELAALVQRLDGRRRVGELRPGDVARRDVTDDRPRHRRKQANDRAIEKRHRRADSTSRA